MLTSVLANAIAPLVLNAKGGLFILSSIIPLETLVLWLFFNKRLPFKISFLRVLFLSAISNIASGLFGFLLPAWYSIFVMALSSIGFLFIVGLIASVLIEWILYTGYFEHQPLPRFAAIKASFLANLISYTCLLFLTVYPLNSSDLLVRTSPSYARQKAFSFSYKVLSLQEIFYHKNSQFSPTLQALELDPISNQYVLGYDTVEDEYYDYQMSAKPTQCLLRAFPKEETFSSFIFFLFVGENTQNKRNFIFGRCRSDRPAIPPTGNPKIVNGSLQCPPDFSGWKRP